MPSVTIPFIGSFSIPLVKFSAQDGGAILYKGQQFINCVFNRRVNEATKTQTISVEKRPGIASFQTVGSGTIQDIHCPSFDPSKLFYGISNTAWVGATYGATVSGISDISHQLGQISGNVKHITSTIIGGYDTICINSTDGTAYYYPIGLTPSQATLLDASAGFTSGSPIITGIASTAGLVVGQNIVAIDTLLPSKTYLVSIDSATQITVSNNALANNASASVYQYPLVKIMDADFPSSTAVGSFAFLDGYAFVMTSAGRVHNSALNNIASWGASDFITANIDADDGVGCVRYKNQIIAFGSNSGEPLYNAGNSTGSPLSRTDGSFFKIGALSSYGITSIEDTIYWVGISESGGLAVYVLNGFTPVKISTPEIDSIINSAYEQGSPTFDVRASRMTGRNWIFVTGSAAGNLNGATETPLQTLVFDTEFNLWHGWGAASSATNIRFNKMTFNLSRVAIIFGGISGLVHICRFGHRAFQKDECTNDSSQTGGYAFNMDVITDKLNFGSNNRTTIARMQLNCDQYASGSVVLQTSDTETASTTTFTGTQSFDVTTRNPQIHRVGSFVGGRAFRFTHSDAAPFRMESVTFDYTKGVH